MIINSIAFYADDSEEYSNYFVISQSSFYFIFVFEKAKDFFLLIVILWILYGEQPAGSSGPYSQQIICTDEYSYLIGCSIDSLFVFILMVFCHAFSLTLRKIRCIGTVNSILFARNYSMSEKVEEAEPAKTKDVEEKEKTEKPEESKEKKLDKEEVSGEVKLDSKARSCIVW